jgi:hypothetical protein
MVEKSDTTSPSPAEHFVGFEKEKKKRENRK